MKLREYSLFLIFIGASCAISLRALLLANIGLMKHQEVMDTLYGIQLQISEENQQCIFLLDKYIK